jgi:chitinase
MCNPILLQVDCKKGPDSDKPAFAAFVRELRAAFRPKGYLLTSAVSPSKVVIDAGVCQVKNVMRVLVLT